MNRKEFISKSMLGTFGIITTSGFGFNLFTNYDDIGIQLPGEQELIKDISRNFLKKEDNLRYYNNTKQKIKEKLPTRKVIYERIDDNIFSRLDKPIKRGYSNFRPSKSNPIEHNKRFIEALKSKDVNMATPIFDFKSSYDQFDISTKNLCDKSIIQLTDYNSIFVMPNDNRLDLTIYEVDDDFSYLIINPKYYCLGLPSSRCEKVIINDELKQKIKSSTGIETKISSYKYQKFTFYGSGICDKGLANGPITTTVYNIDDSALSSYFGLKHIDACGDGKKYDCNLKI